MERLLLKKLANWKSKKNHKPLILKGARQVGKTHLLKAFGAKYYTQYHYFNFEKEIKLAALFQEDLDPLRIIQALQFYQQKAIDHTHDLIIFDEIQACPNALTSLKYFFEDLPQVDICAAGSLLGIYLGPVSYPVGKVDHLELFPMSFLEFLMAIGDELAVKLLQNLTQQTTLLSLEHERLWQYLKHYFIVGGLPEAVQIYRDHKQDLFTCLQLVREKQNDLIEDYFSDIAKHSGKINAMHIRRIWQSIPEQLAKSQDSSAKKFKFKGVIPGIDRFSKLANAIDWLASAGLIIKIRIVNSGKLPFKAYAQENAFKLFLFDVGILGALSEISPKTILDYDYGSYKGFYAENYVAQAFSCSVYTSHYCWMEGKAEVEFLREINGAAIPIEVKAGFVTQAKSIKIFVKKYASPYRVIFSARNLKIDQGNHIQYLPLYLASCFPIVNKHD